MKYNTFQKNNLPFTTTEVFYNTIDNFATMNNVKLYELTSKTTNASNKYEARIPTSHTFQMSKNKYYKNKEFCK